MSHCLGVMCAICREVIIPDDCPERGCNGGHGFGLQDPSPWAAQTWPDHRCFDVTNTPPSPNPESETKP